MKLAFRWYNKKDPIPLEYIRQIPTMNSIVSAVYDVPVGEVWTEESIAEIKAECESNNLIFDVVESIPVSEDIKLGRDNQKKIIANYCENIKRCAKHGVKVITYNFMPVFDWTRTQTDKLAKDGSTSLVLYQSDLKDLDPTKEDIHLPGWDASYNQKEVRSLIKEYTQIGEEGLWRNLEIFLKEVIPIAEQCGVRMAIHPDDPPYSILGLPRIITCEQNIDRMLNIVDSKANCLCFCVGSLGSTNTNDVVAMAEKYANKDKIAFVHLRNVLLLEDNSFEECAHPSPCGSTDMYKVVNALVKNGFDGYVRPDHGRMIWGETGMAGYGLYDRALGATYIVGLFESCQKQLKERA